jgi:hypothetical protein
MRRTEEEPSPARSRHHRLGRERDRRAVDDRARVRVDVGGRRLLADDAARDGERPGHTGLAPSRRVGVAADRVDEVALEQDARSRLGRAAELSEQARGVDLREEAELGEVVVALGLLLHRAVSLRVGDDRLEAGRRQLVERRLATGRDRKRRELDEHVRTIVDRDRLSRLDEPLGDVVREVELAS